MKLPKPGLHPRSAHRGRYDFKLLIKASPELGRFVSFNAFQDESIDFADPKAVKALNRALLKMHYGVEHWDIPDQYLCPPIPGRADYIHHVADLMASCNAGIIPRGPAVRILDIGMGANCIYPIIGQAEYGWQFVGTDVDPVALASAQKIVQANRHLKEAVQLRLQKSRSSIFMDVLLPDEVFDLSLCNPPFHSSAEEARAGSERKWRNLGKAKAASGMKPTLNFGGQPAELWCEGGEAGFVRRMIEQSAGMPDRCRWFSTLLSKESSLAGVLAALRKAKVRSSRVIEMAQGQKKSRIVAWTYFS